MLRNKKTKILALALSVFMLILVLTPFDPTVVGLRQGQWTGRCLYSFFHANLPHYAINVWCFLSCVFLADVSWRKLLLSYLIACSAPAMSTTPTVGLSGVCFALLGMVMWQSPNKRSYNIVICTTILFTTTLCPKAVNNLLHAYCYALGVASMPTFDWLRRKFLNS